MTLLVIGRSCTSLLRVRRHLIFQTRFTTSILVFLCMILRCCKPINPKSMKSTSRQVYSTAGPSARSCTSPITNSPIHPNRSVRVYLMESVGAVGLSTTRRLRSITVTRSALLIVRLQVGFHLLYLPVMILSLFTKIIYR